MVRRARLAVCLAMTALWAAGVQAGAPKANLNCKFEHRIVAIWSFEQLPPPIAEYISAVDVGDGFRRFMRAGQWKEYWFVWSERTDPPGSIRIQIFELHPGYAVQPRARTLRRRENPCEVTDLLLDEAVALPQLLQSILKGKNTAQP